MNKILIKITHTNGSSKSMLLDMEDCLSAIRETLVSHNVMDNMDVFLDDGTEIEKTQEAEIPLSCIVKDHKLSIGKASGSEIEREAGINDYNQLNLNQRKQLFDNIQVFRGLTFSESEGFVKTFKNPYRWATGYQPEANIPRINTKVSSNYSFSKITHELKNLDTDTASVSLDTPFVNAKSEYTHEKSKNTGSSTVTEYLAARFVVRKVSFQIGRTRLVAEAEFVKDVDNALKKGKNKLEKCCNILDTLNEWGFYIPLNFSLGGSLYSTEETQISDFNSAQTEKEEFSVSFKAAFEKIGGGGEYKKASSETETTSKSNKYKNISINQIGGTPGMTDNYPKWAESLRKAGSWSLVSIEKLYPSLMLLLCAENREKGVQLLGDCLQILDEGCSLPAVRKLQPYLNIREYATDIEAMINPFG